MKSLLLSLLTLFATATLAPAQYYVQILKDSVLTGKMELCKGEIYPCAIGRDGKKYVLAGRDSIPFNNVSFVMTKYNFNNIRSEIIQKTKDGKYFILNLSRPCEQLNDTCFLLDSDSKIIQYFTTDFSEKQIKATRLKNYFKIRIPNTPVLVYQSSDSFKIYAPEQPGENLERFEVNDGKDLIVVDPNDKTVAYSYHSDIGFLEKINPAKDSVFRLSKKKNLVYNTTTYAWEIEKKHSAGLFLLIGFLLLCGLLALVWFFVIKRSPVFAIFDNERLSDFASINKSSKKFIFSANEAFRGKNMENEAQKSSVKEALAGKPLLISYKYDLIPGNKFPVYFRLQRDPEKITDLCQVMRISQDELQGWNKKLNFSSFTDTSVNDKSDNIIYVQAGYLYKNTTPRTLAELIELNGKSAGVDTPEQSYKIPAPATTQPRETPRMDIPKPTTPSGTNELFTVFSSSVSEQLNKLGDKIGSLDQLVRQLDETVNQRNKANSNIKLNFFSSESVNALHCINRIQTAERELFDGINALSIADREMTAFVFSCTSRYLINQMQVKERLGFWKSFLEASRGNRSLTTDDLVFKNISDDILQFHGDDEKALFVNRKLFSDLWESYFSNFLVFCEELRNTGQFLNQTSVRDNICKELEILGQKYAQLCLDTAKSLDLNLLYVPLFSAYENSNVKSLDIETFSHFDSFYDTMKERLAKNSVVQVVTYGIQASKIDRSTKTKIRILS